MRGISWLAADQLVSQEGLSSMENGLSIYETQRILYDKVFIKYIDKNFMP
jgi:hypothetical protein